MLMSPFTTLISCGSSSMLVRRMKRPKREIRSSSRPVERVPDRSLVSCRMLRNLNIRNGRLLRPTRGCLKNTGPRESSLMQIATTSMSGARNNRAVAAMVRSNSRFLTRSAKLSDLSDTISVLEAPKLSMPTTPRSSRRSTSNSPFASIVLSKVDQATWRSVGHATRTRS